jgi:hypothetical protein
VTLCESTGPGSGGTWSADDVILFAPNARTLLYRVGAAGGIATPLRPLDKAVGEVAQDWPQFLPDGKHFLYRSLRNAANMITAASLDPKEPHKDVVAADAAFFAPPSRLLYLRGETALAQNVDTGKLVLTGDAVPITEDLGFNPATGYAAVSCSREGTLIYRGGGVPSFNHLVWIDRAGRELAKITGATGLVGEPALSPDGKHLAYAALDAKSKRNDIWIVDLVRGTTTRLTFDDGESFSPRWSPDGTQITYSLTADGNRSQIMERLASGAGAPKAVASGNAISPTDWSRDGRYILFQQVGDRRDVYALERATGRRITVAAGPFGQFDARFSPDGHWIAYVSNESGRPEVYVQAFPPNGGKWQISTTGGQQPAWSRGGKELDYLDPNGKLYAVSIAADGGRFDAGLPTALFQGPLGAAVSEFRHFDPAADGERFVFDPQAQQTEVTPITVVLNWTSELPK